MGRLAGRAMNPPPVVGPPRPGSTIRARPVELPMSTRPAGTAGCRWETATARPPSRTTIHEVRLLQVEGADEPSRASANRGAVVLVVSERPADTGRVHGDDGVVTSRDGRTHEPRARASHGALCDHDPAAARRSPLGAAPHVIRRRAQSRCRHAQGQGRRDRLLDPRRRHGSLDAADTGRCAARQIVRRRHHGCCLLERTDVRALRPAGAFELPSSERAWRSPASLSQVGGLMRRTGTRRLRLALRVQAGSLGQR